MGLGGEWMVGRWITVAVPGTFVGAALIRPCSQLRFKGTESWLQRKPEASISFHGLRGNCAPERASKPLAKTSSLGLQTSGRLVRHRLFCFVFATVLLSSREQLYTTINDGGLLKLEDESKNFVSRIHVAHVLSTSFSSAQRAIMNHETSTVYYTETNVNGDRNQAHELCPVKAYFVQWTGPPEYWTSITSEPHVRLYFPFVSDFPLPVVPHSSLTTSARFFVVDLPATDAGCSSLS